MPFFGRMKLAAIQPSDIKSFLVKLANDGYAAGTIRNALAPLRAMLADAAEDGIIRGNPAAGVRIPSNAKQPEDKPKALTSAQLERLRSKLPTDEAVLFVDFLFATGERISEAMALDWADVDVARCRVRIERRQYRGMDAPKSRTSRRTVKISPTMARRLLALRESRPEALDTDPVFVAEGVPVELRERVQPSVEACAVGGGDRGGCVPSVAAYVRDGASSAWCVSGADPVASGASRHELYAAGVRAFGCGGRPGRDVAG